MDKYEFKVCLEEIDRLIEEQDFAQAAEIADTIDWEKVKNPATICKISDLYKINGRFEDSLDLLHIARVREPDNPQIVYNLCDNAVKYNRDGGEVTVTVSRTAVSGVLTVADTGIGIPAEYQERIFERFFRIDGARSKGVPGTGLGLSIVKHAAQLHGAHVSIDSEPGEGTVIKVSFPLK